MHKRILNELSLELDIAPHNAPLLIKSGHEAGADPTLPDMNFVRTTHPQSGRRVVFLPGSSIKGTLRSYAERLARSVAPQAEADFCCDPFSEKCCGKRLKSQPDAAVRHADSCIACRIFGHTRLGSRLYISDAYPQQEPVLEQRDGVAIDRVSGAVAAGPFNMEVVALGSFRTTLTLRNFQLWQVGLLALTLRDLGDGLVPIGFGKSKGFGRVSLVYHELRLSYPGQWDVKAGGMDFSENLYDLSSFEFESKEAYRLAPVSSKALPLNGEPLETGEYGRVTVMMEDDTAIRSLMLKTVPQWKHAVETWPWTEQAGNGGDSL